MSLFITSMQKKVFAHLDKNKVRYTHVPHKTVYTAYDLANTLKKKLNEIAKTLVVKVDKKYILVVLPANVRVDLEKVKKVLKAESAHLVPEKIMEKIFKIKAGTMTPFGSLHGAEVLLDKALLKTQEVIVNAGTFTDAVRMKAKDLHKLENATLGNVRDTAVAKLKKVARAVAKKVVKKTAPKRVVKKRNR